MDKTNTTPKGGCSRCNMETREKNEQASFLRSKREPETPEPLRSSEERNALLEPIWPLIPGIVKSLRPKNYPEALSAAYDAAIYACDRWDQDEGRTLLAAVKSWIWQYVRREDNFHRSAVDFPIWDAAPPQFSLDAPIVDYEREEEHHVVVPSEILNPEEELLEQEELQQQRERINSLLPIASNLQRDIVFLMQNGMDIQEVAKELKIPPRRISEELRTLGDMAEGI